MNEDKKIKEYLIDFYQKLLENAIKREDYENAQKYTKFLKNLKETKSI